VKHLRPEIRIIGVEPVDADALRQSLAVGKRIRLDHVGLFADGVAVRQVGEETFRLCQALVDEVVTVDTDSTCAAIKDIFEETRSVVEPAGALAVAGLKRWAQEHPSNGQTLVAISSGANMNFNRLRFVAERAETGEEREALFAVTIPEQPGSFKAFCRLLGARSITEFNYRFAEASEAHVFVGLEIAHRQERLKLQEELRKAGLTVLDLTEDEMAKMHIRHLVGGRAPHVDHERLLRFEFPERPGALARFLDRMSENWNISLFHYRNHGADYGRVLTGIQVPPSDNSAFEAFLKNLGYPFVEETENPVFRLFL
jgi:threonine dehydratase